MDTQEHTLNLVRYNPEPTIKSTTEEISKAILSQLSLGFDFALTFYEAYIRHKGSSWDIIGSIAFDVVNEILSIEYEDNKFTILFDEIITIKVHHHKFWNAPKTPPSVEFVSIKGSDTLYYEPTKQLIDLLTILYSKQINIKEYALEERVFLGKKRNYHEIKKIKKDYSIEC